MSTDATAYLHVADERGCFDEDIPTESVSLRRDYLLFDLIAGGRSSNPRDAVVPIRPPPPPDAETYDCYSTFIDADELAIVGAAYRERTGMASDDVPALLAKVRALAIVEGSTRSSVSGARGRPALRPPSSRSVYYDAHVLERGDEPHAIHPLTAAAGAQRAQRRASSSSMASKGTARTFCSPENTSNTR